MFFFFFQAEDGIRDWSVTGVQTCALPIYPSWSPDGQEIVFGRSFEAEMPRVYAVDADGVLGEVAFPNAGGLEPAWSPDGRRIVYRATPGNALTAVTVTGEAKPLRMTGADPDWQAVPNTRPTVSAP